VPRYHAMGAAIALLLATLVRMVFASAILRRALRACPAPASLGGV
jgi:hypothetical protein